MRNQDRAMEETRDVINSALDLLGADSPAAGGAILQAIAATDPQRRRELLKEALAAIASAVAEEKALTDTGEEESVAQARAMLEAALKKLAALRA